MAETVLTWRDAYYDATGTNIANLGYSIQYVSPVGSLRSGTGTRNNPTSIKKLFDINGTNSALVIASGFNGMTIKIGGQPNIYIIGQGMYDTEMDIQLSGYISGNIQSYNVLLKDMRLTTFARSNGGNIAIDGCLVACSNAAIATTIINSKITGASWGSSSGYSNSFVSIADQLNGTNVLRNNLSIFDKCAISISQADVNSHEDKYIGFDNCTFKIGTETTYTALTGTTEATLRANFVERCTNAGITLHNVTDYAITNKAGRWVFTKGSTLEGAIIKGSEMDTFQTLRFIKLGYNKLYFDNIVITSNNNVPKSFATSNPKSENIEVYNGTIRLKENVSIVEPYTEQIMSKIIWLGGKNKVTNLDITNNLPNRYGVAIDNSVSLGNAVTAISPDVNYVIRSSDDQVASVKYNNVEYTSSLITGNNVFRGVSGVAAFTVPTANAKVYQVLDYALHRTVRMRVVDEIPTTQIKTGNLQTGYWYIVAPDSVSDTNGTITIDGVAHPCYDSFLAASASTFVISGNLHLRRCWRNGYSQDTEVTDQAFWANRQKPKWVDVVIYDMRCLMRRNSSYSGEMQSDDNGNYIGSGHTSFYNSVSGDSGVLLPSYPIAGAYIQIELVITTLNPM